MHVCLFQVSFQPSGVDRGFVVMNLLGAKEYILLYSHQNVFAWALVHCVFNF